MSSLKALRERSDRTGPRMTHVLTWEGDVWVKECIARVVNLVGIDVPLRGRIL